MTEIIIPFVAAAALIVWSAFQGRLSRRAQPLRLQLADRGEALLARPDLTDETRKDVQFMLGTAFPRPFMLLFCVVVVPFVALYTVARPGMRTDMHRRYLQMSPKARTLYGEVRALHNRIVLANHPLLASIVVFEVAALMAPFGLLMLAFQREEAALVETAVTPMDRYAFISIVEMQEHTLMGRLRKGETVAATV